MNAGGVPNTCKSSGKVLHLVFDQVGPFKRKPLERNFLAKELSRILSVEYTSGGRVSNA